MKDSIHFKQFLQTIGQNLFAIRKQCGRELETVAEAVNLLPEVINQIENGNYNWDVEMVVRLCEYYKISVKAVTGELEVLG